jgi:putative endonuclease
MQAAPLSVMILTCRRSSNHGTLRMSTARCYWVYILASKIGGILYIGVTNNLVRRIYEHKMGLADGFTKQYGIHRLVYYERYDDIESAILREKRLKKWNRAWKVRLIEDVNPNWDDVYSQIANP